MSAFSHLRNKYQLLKAPAAPRSPSSFLFPDTVQDEILVTGFLCV